MIKTAKKNIVLLDYISKITYVIPYDILEGEDVEELREESIREYARFRIKNKDVESVRPRES